jgi:hypothetical protein
MASNVINTGGDGQLAPHHLSGTLCSLASTLAARQKHHTSGLERKGSPVHAASLARARRCVQLVRWTAGCLTRLHCSTRGRLNRPLSTRLLFGGLFR